MITPQAVAYKDCPRNDHGQRQQLAAGQPAQGIKAYVRVRLPGKFDHKAKQTINHQEQAADDPCWARFFTEPEQNDKQHQTFKKGLIKLRGMARQLLRVAGEYHTPGTVSLPPPQLLANKVANAAKPQPY